MKNFTFIFMIIILGVVDILISISGLVTYAEKQFVKIHLILSNYTKENKTYIKTTVIIKEKA